MSDTTTTPTPPPAARTVRCPGCGGDSLYASANPFRPFCSARCKGLDLGAWANESFRVPDPATDEAPWPENGQVQ